MQTRRRSATLSSASAPDLAMLGAQHGQRAMQSLDLATDQHGAQEGGSCASDLPEDSRTRYFVVFDLLDVRCKGVVPVSQFIGTLKQGGLHNEIIKRIISACDPNSTAQISFEQFFRGMHNNPYFEEVRLTVEERLVIPQFPKFVTGIKEIIATLTEGVGNVASYIPQLASVDPTRLSVAVHTINGQVWSQGYDQQFTVQSCFLPVAYLVAQQQLGEEKLAQYIGSEPSGLGFREFALKDGKPHNPMVSAGAILLMSLLYPDLVPSDRFQKITDIWTELTVSKHIGFDNSVYLSELASADRNFALAHYMKNEGCFPDYVKTKAHLDEHMKFYFRNCAISATAKQVAAVAATLANGGKQPVSKKQIFSVDHVRNCLSVMNGCGLYDRSGQFAYEVGCPAKASVSGCIMLVVPGVMGICIYSPRVDSFGVSAQGYEFCQKLAARYPFHIFDQATGNSKEDPTRPVQASGSDHMEGPNVLEYAMLYGAIKGDIGFIQSLIPAGVSVNVADVDGRTPLHLAALHGNLATVSMLLDCGADFTLRDRFGRTAVDEALQSNNRPALSLLKDKGARISTREERLATMAARHERKRRSPRSPQSRREHTSERVLRSASTVGNLSVPQEQLLSASKPFASAADIIRKKRVVQNGQRG